jgi:hypothetical protein
MALRKNYENGKQVYARIEQINYGKKFTIFITIQIYETDPSEVLIPINSIQYAVREAEGTGWENFSVDAMNFENQNLVKISYDYIKQNVAIFSDFEDC